MGICRAIVRDIELGDLKNIEIGLSRIIGKIQDAPPSDDDSDLGKLPQDQLVERVEQAINVIKMNRAKDGTFTPKDSE